MFIKKQWEMMSLTDTENSIQKTGPQMFCSVYTVLW